MIQRGIRNNYTVLVGGAPLNEKFCEFVGADAYCIDAGAGVMSANAAIAERHQEQDNN